MFFFCFVKVLAIYTWKDLEVKISEKNDFDQEWENSPKMAKNPGKLANPSLDTGLI